MSRKAPSGREKDLIEADPGSQIAPKSTRKVPVAQANG